MRSLGTRTAWPITTQPVEEEWFEVVYTYAELGEGCTAATAVERAEKEGLDVRRSGGCEEGFWVQGPRK